jgi:hypothetical protein
MRREEEEEGRSSFGANVVRGPNVIGGCNDFMTRMMEVWSLAIFEEMRKGILRKMREAGLFEERVLFDSIPPTISDIVNTLPKKLPEENH